ncbi:unnamed protein product [Mytilus edulis]|uniref:VWFD domain-containing protein n=1 Tax=Mytilus edulis TaxID=6550 RepID=A0A8S3TBW1_MYTED|nr:unnamed protein product [Mytilus edulis]
MPVGCMRPERAGCFYPLHLVQPKYQTECNLNNCEICNGNVQQGDLSFIDTSCLYSIFSSTWDQPIILKVTGYVNGQYDYADRTAYLRVESQKTDFYLGAGVFAWDNARIPEIKIIVTDEEHQMAGRLCESVNDPHFYTADRYRWDNYEPNEYILYRHKTKPYQVNALYGDCNDGASCNCGVAIRSGHSMFVMRTCYSITRYETLTHPPIIEMRSCDDSSMIIKENGGTYTVTLPIGTEIKFSTSAGWGHEQFIGYIHVKPSLLDVENSEGLCGRVSGGSMDTSDDFTLRDGTIIPTTYSNWETFAKTGGRVRSCFCYFLCINVYESQSKQAQENSQRFSYNMFIIRERRGVGFAPYYNKSLTDSDDILDNRKLYIAPDSELSAFKRNHTDEWPVGWTETKAREVCQSGITGSITEDILETSHITSDGYIEQCMFDIKHNLLENSKQEISALVVIKRQRETLNNDNYRRHTIFRVTISSLQEVAISEISRNVSLFVKDNATGTASSAKKSGELLLGNLCKNNCSNNGVCQNDKHTRRFNSRNITCRSRHLEILKDGNWIYRSDYQTYEGQYRNSYLVSCELPTARRKKRSTSESVIADGYEISLSTDGNNFGDNVKIMIYDLECFSCHIENNTCVELDTCPIESTTEAITEPLAEMSATNSPIESTFTPGSSTSSMSTTSTSGSSTSSMSTTSTIETSSASEPKPVTSSTSTPKNENTDSNKHSGNYRRLYRICGDTYFSSKWNDLHLK